MSCYWTFYVLKKNKENKFDYAGAVQYDARRKEYVSVSLECRSRSFIDGDHFNTWDIFNIDQLSDEAKKILFCGDIEQDDYFLGSEFRIIPFSEHYFAPHDLITRGYVSLEEFDIITKSKYDPDYLRWEADIKSPEYIAALPVDERVKYTPVAWCDKCSSDYIYETILHGCDMLGIYPFEDDYYIFCDIG